MTLLIQMMIMSIQVVMTVVSGGDDNVDSDDDGTVTSGSDGTIGSGDDGWYF
jgi:hypothetical protein